MGWFTVLNQSALIEINFVASAWMSRDFSARFVQCISLLMARSCRLGMSANSVAMGGKADVTRVPLNGRS